VDTRPIPTRIVPPRVPSDTVTLTSPPRLGAARRPRGGLPLLWVPVVAAASVLLVVLAASGSPLLLAVGLVVFVSVVGLAALSYTALWWEPRRTLRLERERYLRHVDVLRRRLGQAAREQRNAASWSHPAPEHLLDIARSTRRYERRPADHDFGHVRAGLGSVDLALRLQEEPESNPLAACEPVAAAAAADLRDRPRQLPHMPVTVDLGAGITSLVGEPVLTREMARSILCQAAAFHDPTEVRLAFARHLDNQAAWEWVKWLPHADVVTDRVSEIANLLADQVAARIARRRERDRRSSPGLERAPRLIVVVDAEKLPLHDLDFRSHGVGLLDLDIHLIHLVGADDDAPRQIDQRIRIDRSGAELTRGHLRQAFRPDATSAPVAQMLARQLAAHVPSEAAARAIETRLPSLRDLSPTAEDADDAFWQRRFADPKPLCTPFVTYERKQPASLRPLLRPSPPAPSRHAQRWATHTTPVAGAGNQQPVPG
jgi:S-DNA-T family DNA segregation ATPase FtsK/SpoIIIE